MEEPIFLTVDQVIELHRVSIDKYGGSHGLKDRGLLESAVMAPRQTFGGEFLYPDLASMTAALWHGLVMNHAFVDGNKRIGLRAADVFLMFNGYELVGKKKELVSLTIRMTMGEFTRDDLVSFVRTRMSPYP